MRIILEPCGMSYENGLPRKFLGAQNLGYSHAKIPTQTNTWLACRVYLDLGFLPIKKNLEHSYEGWKIVKELTGHSALKGI